MASWYDPKLDDYIEFEVPMVEMGVTEEDCPVLLGPDGEPLVRLSRRVPFGFHREETDA